MKQEHNHTDSRDRRRVSLSDALDAVGKVRSELPSAAVFEHGSLQVKMYRPGSEDFQTPHTRDEVYFVVQGSGWFENGTERHPFQSGDMLFVPAGTLHRFEKYTDDFCTWVVFYGPEGGERVNDATR
jgi:mannose-6-phosphate isomerase-like protein (cupin superfamily)